MASLERRSGTPHFGAGRWGRIEMFRAEKILLAFWREMNKN
jgi:hypothetical protein